MRRFNSYIADLAESLVADKISVLVAGNSASLEYGTNGKPETLILPEPKKDLDEKTLRLYNGYVDHEVSHAEDTDIEVRREYKSKFAESEIALFVGQVVEDCHIEIKRTSKWKGSIQNLLAVFDTKLWAEYEREFAEPDSVLSELDNFILGAPSFLRALYQVPGHQEFLSKNLRVCSSVIDRLRSEVDFNSLESSTEAAENAEQISNILSEMFFEQQDEDDDDEDEGEDEENQDDTEDESEGDESEPEEGDEETDSGGENNSEEQNQDLGPGERFKNPGNGDVGHEIEIELHQDDDESGDYSIMSKAYDMVDVRIESLIEEHSTMPGDFSKLTFDTEADHLVSSIQRKIIGRTNSGWSSGHVSGVIDPKKVSRFALGDDRIFRRRSSSAEKSAAAIILIDMSYSMVESNRISEAFKAAFALSQVMDRVGVSCKVMGHTTANQVNKGGMPINLIHYLDLTMADKFTRIQPLLMPKIKDWNQPANKNTFELATYEGLYQDNIDGEAVDICCRMLVERPETKKMLFVLSDGMPEAMCGSDKSHLSFENHLRQVVDKWRKRISMCSLGIGTNHAGHLFPFCNVSKDANDMSEKLLTMFDSMEK